MWKIVQCPRWLPYFKIIEIIQDGCHVSKLQIKSNVDIVQYGKYNPIWLPFYKMLDMIQDGCHMKTWWIIRQDGCH